MVYVIQVCWQQTVSKRVWHIPLLCVQWKTPDDGQRNCPKHVEFHSKNKFETLVHLVGFIISTNILLFEFHMYVFSPLWRCGPTRAMASSFLRFLDHTQWRTTVGRTPLHAWSARRRDLYLTPHNTQQQTDRQTSMPPVGFEPTISAGERP